MAGGLLSNIVADLNIRNLHILKRGWFLAGMVGFPLVSSGVLCCSSPVY